MKEIDVMGLFKALQEKGEAKLSDHEIKEPQITELMKKYFIKETKDVKNDLFVSEYKIPAGKDFDKCMEDILKYFSKYAYDKNSYITSAKAELKSKKLSNQTGASIKISQNTFECSPLVKELNR